MQLMFFSSKKYMISFSGFIGKNILAITPRLGELGLNLALVVVLYWGNWAPFLKAASHARPLGEP